MFNIGDVVNVYKGDDYLVSYFGTVVEVCNTPDELYMIKDGTYHEIFPSKNLRKRYTHLSPSGLKLFEQNPDEFYMKYIARYKPPAIPQTQPMSVGSSFDAYAKAFINSSLSKTPLDPKYQFEALFASQVEEQNRSWARDAGLKCFKAYCESGAMADLMLQINEGDATPQFEFKVQGTISAAPLKDTIHDKQSVYVTKDQVGSVCLAGVPDLYYRNKHALHVITDFKVNGYCSNSGSPKAGYCKIRGPGSNSNQPHRDAMVQRINGIDINIACHLEDIDKDWATQLSVYAWLMGEPVGGDYAACIEQLACGPRGIRAVSYRNKIGKMFQEETFHRFWLLSEDIRTGWFFSTLSRMDNDLKCLELEKLAETLRPIGDDNEDWFRNLGRSHNRF